MMKKILYILLGVVVVVGVGLVVYMRFYNSDNQTNSPQPQNTNQPASTNQPVATTPTVIDASQAAKTAAMLFAERYGTYSSDQPFQNLKSISNVVTAAFQSRLNSIMNQATQATNFYSSTTRAVMGKVEAISSDAAQVSVTAQRQEKFDRAGAPRVSYQTLAVNLVYIGKTWLVDSATWQQ